MSISKPSDGGGNNCAPALYQSTIEVSGFAQLVKNEQLWILIQAPVIGRFYITQGPVRVGPDHAWSQLIKYIGSKEDRGQLFQLVAVSADLNAANALARVFYASDDRSLASLPTGATAAAQVCVQRTD